MLRLSKALLYVPTLILHNVRVPCGPALCGVRAEAGRFSQLCVDMHILYIYLNDCIIYGAYDHMITSETTPLIQGHCHKAYHVALP